MSNSGSLSWCRSNQVRSSAGVVKNSGSIGPA
jgi:hypothetical protein